MFRWWFWYLIVILDRINFRLMHLILKFQNITQCLLFTFLTSFQKFVGIELKAIFIIVMTFLSKHQQQTTNKSLQNAKRIESNSKILWYIRIYKMTIMIEIWLNKLLVIIITFHQKHKNYMETIKMLCSTRNTVISCLSSQNQKTSWS